MSQTQKCESCGMPIATGVYCQYCTDETGKLQSFEVRFERMVEWAVEQDPKSDRAAVEKDTLAHMSTLPAWKDHPRVKAAATQR